MFQFLRKMIGPIMITVLVAFVATIIFSWGGGGFQDRPDDTIAVIDGEKIPFRVFDRYYSNTYREEQQKSDEDISPEKAEQLRTQAWQKLLADYLFEREIAKYNIYVTDEEIYSFLKLFPPQYLQQAQQFITDGQFDYQKYVSAMVNPENAVWWAQVETNAVPELKKYKLQEEIINTVRVTPAEVMETFLMEKELVKVAYTYLADREILNKLDSITQDEIAVYYEAHKDDYKKSEQAVLKLVTFPKEASDMDWGRLRAEIDLLYDSAVAGTDFAELARTFSEDNSAADGGNLGWFERGRMVPAFDSAVFAMKVDEISSPIKTRYGFHVIKLHDIKTEKETPRGESKAVDIEKRNASHILLKITPSQATLDQLSQNAGDFVNQAREIGYEEAAETYNYTISETQPFENNGYITIIGRNPAVSEFTFGNDVGTTSDVFEDKTNFFAVKIADRIPEDYTPLEEASSAIERTIKVEKAKKTADDSALVVYEALADSKSMRNTAYAYGFTYDTTGLINKRSIIRNIGSDPEVIGRAFALENKGDISQPIRYSNGAVILKLMEHVSPDLEEFNQLQDSLYAETLLKKQEATYRKWYENLVKNTEIENYIDRFYTSY
jgi:peptidyl-prolyl cis-trans isomerase D